MRSFVWQHPGWPGFTWDTAVLARPLGDVRKRQGILLGRVGELDLDLGRQARVEILVEESLRTSEIEGEKLTADGVRSSVARRLGLPTAGLPLPGPREDGLVQMLLDATERHGEELNPRRLKGWHGALFPTGYSGLRQVRAGEWRDVDPMQVVSGPIGRERVHYEAPPSRQVEAEMSRFFDWWRSPPEDLDGLLRAGVGHFWFVTIHPFEDGNGRIARALTDMALAQDEVQPVRYYSLSAQIMSERDDYYDCLASSQRGKGDLTSWLQWFVGCVGRAVERSEGILERVLSTDRFWRRHARTSLNERQQKAVQRLLDAGPHGFEGGLTTRKYVGLTRASRATAYREITDLVSKGILRPSGRGGRSASYELVFPPG